MAGTNQEDTGTSIDTAVGWLTEKAAQFSDDADELRATTDRAAKGLGALAGAGLTGVGVAKVGDLFPEPSSGGFWPGVMFLWLGFVLMVVAILAFVYRFWRANRPLPLSARAAEMWNQRDPKWRRRRGDRYTPFDEDDPDLGEPVRRVRDVGAAECEEIEGIYKDAIRHAAFCDSRDETLAHYEWRADKLERDAWYLPDAPASERRLAQVERMRAEIEKAEQRAKLVVVRRRMNRVFSGPIAASLALVFVVGLVMFATAADYFDNKHLESSRQVAPKVR
jgi:hypothetical protein